MRNVSLALLAGAAAILATGAQAAPMQGGSAALARDNPVEQVRLVCNEWGRCWHERRGRRVIIDNSYDYAPRERFVERRRYYHDEPRAGIGFSAPGVSVGVGVGNRY